MNLTDKMLGQSGNSREQEIMDKASRGEASQAELAELAATKGLKIHHLPLAMRGGLEKIMLG